MNSANIPKTDTEATNRLRKYDSSVVIGLYYNYRVLYDIEPSFVAASNYAMDVENSSWRI